MNYYCDSCFLPCAQDICVIPTYDNDVLEVNVCSDLCLKELIKEALEVQS